MDHSLLGEPKKGFRFKFIEPEEHDETLKFLQNHLYGSLAPVGYSEEHPHDWNNLFRDMLKSGHNLSYVAVHEDTGELAACRMVDVIMKDQTHNPPEFQHKRNQEIIQLCADICKNENIFEKHGVDKYADMFGLAVNPKFRQQGLATEMYSRGLQCLKKKDFKIVKCGFISPYSRKAGQKHGYQEFARRHFHECKDDKGNVLNPDAAADDFICFGIFNLEYL